MKRFILILAVVMFGCKNPEMSELDTLAEKRMDTEEDIIARSSGEYSLGKFKYHNQIELSGKEAELLEMKKLDDSLRKALYMCKNP